MAFRTGKRGLIQVSQATANLLFDSGKGRWVRQREDSVAVKGKGVIKTYWINPSTESLPSVSDSEVIMDGKALRNVRSVKWMTQLLTDYAKKVHRVKHAEQNKVDISLLPLGKTPLEEVVEIITLKDFHANCINTDDNIESNGLPLEIEGLLHELVSQIATFYHSTPFHNFEHGKFIAKNRKSPFLTFLACWVAMSADKFLKRIVTPKVDDSQMKKWASKNSAATEIASHLNDYTHGISSGKENDCFRQGCSSFAQIQLPSLLSFSQL